MGQSPPIINDILNLGKNASCNLRSGVTVTRKNRRTSKFGVETNSTIGAVLQENLTKDIKNPDGLNIFKHFLFFFFLSGFSSNFHQNANMFKQREGNVTSMNVSIYIFLIKNLLHKLLTIVTRFPVLLKISVLRKLYLVRAKDYKSITCSSNNQFKVSQSPYSSQWLLPNTGYLSPWKFNLH